jgi:hypothetical protein
MMTGAEFRRCLLELDVQGIKAVWGFTAPHLPQPDNDYTALASLHMARTSAQSMPFKARAWSHAWLRERDLPSLLPDELRPRAERTYPAIKMGVGLAVRALSAHNKPVARFIQSAMEDAVREADADGRLADDQHVKARIDAARRKAIDEVYG